MWMQGKKPGAGAGFGAIVRDYGNALDLSFVDEVGHFAVTRIGAADSALQVANHLRTLADAIMLDWESAERLRLEGKVLEYRDGGAFHRELEWRPVDGPITDHMSDLEFRRVLPRAHPQAGA